MLLFHITLADNSLGPSLLKGVREAIPARIEQAAVFTEFTKSLPKPNVMAWTQAVEEWEENPERPNPFETTVPHTSDLPALLS